MIATPWNTINTQERPHLQPWTLPAAAWELPTKANELEAVSGRFAPISLAQMEAAALLDRVDIKFAMTTDQLLEVLSELTADYYILSINGTRLQHYRTLYFDTPDFELFNMHVNGQAERFKVRSREYADSCLSFLEVKLKTRKGRTIKERIPTPQPVTGLSADSETWLHTVHPSINPNLEPKLGNSFTRITLVGKNTAERVTIDVDLSFYAGSKTVQLDGVAIAEVKMSDHTRSSTFWKAMHARHIRPFGFSKYCVGVSMLYEHVKKNALKPKLRRLEKITYGAYSHE